MKAGFARADITPGTGGEKIGWIKSIPIERILDPLFARIAVFENSDERVAFIQTDTLSIRWTQTRQIRERVEAEYGFPGDAVMLAATHNHSGPAVASVGDVERDDGYIDFMVATIVEAFGAALGTMREAEIGFAQVFEFGLSHNRRTVLRDGTVITHGAGYGHPLALYTEGPIDPEVAVLAAREPGGELLGALVNFACHPVHHGGEPVITAGYPGALAREMAERGCPELVFLNGACGNISPGNPPLGLGPDMDEIGERLAEDAFRAIETMTFQQDLPLASTSTTVTLPYREYTDDDIDGTAKGAQRFVDPSAYDRAMPALLARIEMRETQPAEVQTLRVGEVTFTGVPAEFFVQLGLRIKEAAYPLHGLVVGHANGMVGYVPHREAFERGGYETTFGPGWRMGIDAGDRLVEAATAVLEPWRCEAGRRKHDSPPGIGIQLYSVRDLTGHESFKETLSALGSMGFDAVEFAWNYGGMGPEELAAYLDEVGLRCCGMHVQLDELLDPDNAVYRIARAVGSEFITTSLAGRIDEWGGLLPQLDKAGAVAAEHGLQFTYHNHWQEFERIGGAYALDLLIERTDPELVKLELDLGWVKKGGEDPMALWRRHAERIPQIHCRDYDPVEEVDCDVGEGFMDVAAVLAQARELGTRWVIYEQSTYPLDSLSSCRHAAGRLVD